MSDFPRQSLIEQAKQQPSQPSLFGAGGSESMDAALFAAEESRCRNPEFTGARLFAKKPELYKSIIALSAEGLGVLRIGRLLHVSPNTVLAVRAREPVAVDIERKRLAGLSREAARMCVEGILEMLADPKQVAKMSIRDKGIVAGILTEKSELLTGGATARLETQGHTASVDIVEYLRWIKDEYASRIGSGGEKEGQRALAAGPVGGGDAPGAGASGPAEGSGGDAEKAEKGDNSQDCERPANIGRNAGEENIIEADSANR